MLRVARGDRRHRANGWQHTTHIDAFFYLHKHAQLVAAILGLVYGEETHSCHLACEEVYQNALGGS